eukprot:TRINITY_DN5845_c0_g1_i1.p1 TRINITY_DN5845_c0_g1~~TRINITY_DN5845_c0_g1_i1.p1  ORF type:complete len:246 (+),score=37.85 TRINITY_DN5845_c0_g1_i1:261-998(+)
MPAFGTAASNARVPKNIFQVRHNDNDLGDRRVNLYLAGTIIACVMYLLVASVFYMWAYRWPLPEEYAQKRRIYGIIVNLIFSDVPMFAIEVDIVWQVGVASAIQGVCFVFTCVSFGYSAIRTWIYVMVTVIKATKPPQQLSGLPPGGVGGVALGQAPSTSVMYDAGVVGGADTMRYRAAEPQSTYMSPGGMNTSGAAGVSTAAIQQRGGGADYHLPSTQSPSAYATQMNTIIPKSTPGPSPGGWN